MATWQIDDASSGRLHGREVWSSGRQLRSAWQLDDGWAVRTRYLP